MKWISRIRGRRDRWFDARLDEQFPEHFAGSHDVVAEKKKRELSMYDIMWLSPYSVKKAKAAKHVVPPDLEKRLKLVEQAVCEHAFCDAKTGCLDTIFCGKCGALHPDWEQCSYFAWNDNKGYYMNEDGSKYVPELTIKDQDYRRKEV